MNRIDNNVRCIFAVLFVLMFEFCSASSSVLLEEETRMIEADVLEGAWISPQYGTMTICNREGSLVGTFGKGNKKGTFRGTMNNGVFYFNWHQQHQIIAGKIHMTSGTGFFRLRFDPQGKMYLDGEWEYDEREKGRGAWMAYRLKDNRGDPCLRHISLHSPDPYAYDQDVDLSDISGESVPVEEVLDEEEQESLPSDSKALISFERATYEAERVKDQMIQRELMDKQEKRENSSLSRND